MHSPRRLMWHCLFWRTNGYPVKWKLMQWEWFQTKKALFIWSTSLLLRRGWVWGLDQRVELIPLTKCGITEGPSGSREGGGNTAGTFGKEVVAYKAPNLISEQKDFSCPISNLNHSLFSRNERKNVILDSRTWFQRTKESTLFQSQTLLNCNTQF